MTVPELSRRSFSTSAGRVMRSDGQRAGSVREEDSQAWGRVGEVRGSGHTEGGVGAWMALLAGGGVQGQQGIDVLDSQWVMTVPHFRTRESVARWERQTAARGRGRMSQGL